MAEERDREGLAEHWLVTLAQDVIDHDDNCWGCRDLAAQALEKVGRLDEVLRLTGKSDPRKDELPS